MSKATSVLVGVDGCKGGWIAALERSGAVTVEVFAKFDAVLHAAGPGAVVVVDMPIGLPERIRGPGRAAEQAVRPLLRERRSSVFSVPGRAAVESFPLLFQDELHRREAHRRASALARRLSDPPKGVSIQSFMLFGKIIEIDRRLRAEPGLCDRMIEGHPEMAFLAMNGGEPARHAKKGRGAPEREALLAGAGLDPSLFAPVPRGAARDDLLDALALLVTARRFHVKQARPYPDPPERDAHGLPIAIWA